MELQRSFAADEQPVAALLRPGVEELDLAVEIHPRAPAREEVAPRGVPRGKGADVDGVEYELDGREVLVEGHDLRGHVEQLRRFGGTTSVTRTRIGAGSQMKFTCS